MKVNHSLFRLFTSKTRTKLITILFSQPSELYYVRQLVRATEEEINSVRRELENLKTENLVLSEARGNRLYYSANLNHYLGYQMQVLANQNSGLGKKLLQDKNKLGSIRLMLYSQDFLNHQSNGNVDIIIVGEISVKLIEAIIKEEEAVYGREINYMIMDRSEYKVRRVRRDPILVDFYLSCPAVIIGRPSDVS